MKKFTALLLCLLTIITCGLAGCASFSIDKVKYYNDVVATIGDTHITRYELLSSYNSFGKDYYLSQLGQSESEAIRSTLDLLVDREALYLYAKDNDETYRPKPYQVNNLIEKMFESMDSQMDEYITTATKMLNAENKSDKKEEEKEEDLLTRSKYDYKESRRATIVKDGDSYKIEYLKKDEDEENEDFEEIISLANLENFEKNDTIEEIKTKYFDEHLKEKVNELNYEYKDSKHKVSNTVIYDKVISLLVDDLIDYEYYLRDKNNKPYSKTTEDLITRYIKRSFESDIKSQYLENIRTEYLKTENLSIELLEESFEKMIAKSYDKYSTDTDAYKKAMKDIGTNGDTILYHPNLDDAKFGYFVHTLISFSDTQKTKIENLAYDPENEDNDSIDDKELYENIVLGIGDENKFEISYRDAEGKDAGTTTLSNVLKEYETIYNMPNSNQEEYNAKLSAFIDFMFKYTGDTGTLSAGMPYVVGTNGNSAMEENFTEEAIALMKTNEQGAMSKVDFTAGSTEGMCITSYGIHFVFYVGDVNAYDVPYGDVDSMGFMDEEYKDKEGSNYNNLTTKILNPLTGETYFDMLFDKVYPAGIDTIYTTNTGYPDEEEIYITASKAKHKYVPYEQKINATKANI